MYYNTTIHTTIDTYVFSSQAPHRQDVVHDEGVEAEGDTSGDVGGLALGVVQAGLAEHEQQDVAQQLQAQEAAVARDRERQEGGQGWEEMGQDRVHLL